MTKRTSAASVMIVNLTKATVGELAQVVFDHSASDDEDAWYYGDLDFEIEPDRQLRLLAELFHSAPSLFKDYSTRQVEEGLWCMMGGAHSDKFCGLVWNPALPRPARLDVVAGVYTLYDRVLATYPHEQIDFRHPDADPRRFRTIDYMAPDLLLHRPRFRHEDELDVVALREAFLDLFSRLLAHGAPVAQYAALHGLGHLQHEGGVAVIDRYLEAHAWLEPAQREYAEAARTGDVL